MQVGLEGLAQLQRRGEAAVRLEVAGLVGDLRELAVNLWRVGVGLGVDGLDQGCEQGLARMAGSAGHELVQRRAEEVDVGARADISQTAGHLRRHVGRGADDGRGVVALVEALGHAPVDQVDLAKATEHHVVGLDVEVEDPMTVGEVGGEAHLHQDLEVLLEAVALERCPVGMVGVGEQGRPGDPLDALHHQHRLVAAAAEGIDRRNVRVLQATHEPRLADQRLPGSVGVGVLGSHALDRDLAVEPGLARQLDSTHAALAHRAQDLEGVARADLARAGPAQLQGRQCVEQRVVISTVVRRDGLALDLWARDRAAGPDVLGDAGFAQGLAQLVESLGGGHVDQREYTSWLSGRSPEARGPQNCPGPGLRRSGPAVLELDAAAQGRE